MKKYIVILFLLPFTSFSQCFSYLNAAPDSSLKLLPTIEKYFGFELRRTNDPFSLEKINYVDSLGFAYFSIFSERKKEYNGTNIIMGLPLVNRIYINGPSDRIDLIFNYFKTTFKKCPGFSSADQWMFIGKTKINWENSHERNGIPCKQITIESNY